MDLVTSRFHIYIDILIRIFTLIVSRGLFTRLHLVMLHQCVHQTSHFSDVYRSRHCHDLGLLDIRTYFIPFLSYSLFQKYDDYDNDDGCNCLAIIPDQFTTKTLTKSLACWHVCKALIYTY